MCPTKILIKLLFVRGVWVDIMKCYLVHAYFSGGLDRQIAFNFNTIHVCIKRYVFVKKTSGFSNEDWKSVAKAQNENKFRCFLRQHLADWLYIYWCCS